MGLRIRIEGYQIGDGISKDALCRLVKGRRLSDHQAVIIKVADAPGMDTEVRREFEFIEIFPLSFFPCLIELTECDDRRVEILGDFGAQALDEIVETTEIDLETFLLWAIALARQLDQLHQAGLIHRNLNPENILFNPEKKEVRFIGLYDTSVGIEHTPHFEWSIRHYHNLAYIAPEQTGTVYRQIDCRADYYALGCIFYRLLTGQAPFIAQDPHRDLKRIMIHRPVAPSDLKRAPKMVSNLVMKLMEKSPENRYQSLTGLIDDLMHCLDLLRIDGEISLFPLATTDIRQHFYISQCLYGRQQAFSTLQEILETVTKGKKQIVVIEGPAGVGKSALMTSLYSDIAERNYLFAHGRFESLSSDMPYAGFIQAFDTLISRCTEQSFERFNLYRQQLDEFMGNSQAALVKVLPSLSAFSEDIGILQPVDGVGEQRRFHAAWARLIKALVSVDGGLVCVLENIDEIDMASARLLIELIREVDLSHFMLVLTCRHWPEDRLSQSLLQSTVQKSHPQDLTLSYPVLHRITLSNLSVNAFRRLIEDSFPLSRMDQVSLGGLIYRKVEGNPKAGIALLEQLNKQQIIKFDSDSGQWQVDFLGVESLDLEEISDQTQLKQWLAELSPSTIQALRTAACMGLRFSLILLTEVLNWEPQHLFSHLRPALFGHVLALIKDDQLKSEYLFLKGTDAADLIAQLSVDEYQEIHKKIAQCLIRHSSTQLLPLFHHIVLAGNKWPVTDPVVFGELCLSAAEEGIQSAAYETVIEVTAEALSRLSEAGWQVQHGLMLSLYMKAYEAAFLSHQVSQAHRLFQTMATHITRPEDWFSVNSLRLSECVYLEDFEMMGLLGEEMLDRLGISLPDDGALETQTALAYEAALSQATVESLSRLLTLSPTLDERQRFIVHLYAKLSRPIFRLDSRLYPYLTAKAFSFCLETGVVPGVERILAEFAFVCATRRAVDKAWLIFQMGFRLADTYGLPKNRLRICALFSTDHWWRPLLSPIHLAHQIEQDAIAEGDPASLGMAYVGILNVMWGLSSSIDHGVIRSVESLRVAKEALHPVTKPVLVLFQQLYLALSGKTLNLSILDDRLFKENLFVETLSYDFKRFEAISTLYYWIFKAYLFLLNREYENAFVFYEKAEKHLPLLGGIWLIVEYRFFYALTAAHLLMASDNETQKCLYRQVIHQSLNCFEQWQISSPANFEPRYQLLKAMSLFENSSADGLFEIWEDAVYKASHSHCLKELAAFHELMADCLLARNLPLYGLTHLIGAIDAYKSWGASAKVTLLTDRFHQLSTQKATIFPPSFSHTLDLTIAEAVVSMVQETMKENNSSKMIEVLTQRLGQYATATLILLAVKENDQLVFKGCAGVDKKDYELMIGEAVEHLDAHAFPKYLMALTCRIESVLFWPQVANEIPLEAYIHAINPASAICMPLLYKSELMGVVYIENRYISDLYRVDRLDLLNVLIAMTAILMSNHQNTVNLQESILDLEERFNERSASLSMLVSGVAHEINTPIGNALTASSHMRQEIKDIHQALSASSLSKSQLHQSMTIMEEGIEIVLQNLKRSADLVRNFKQVSIEQSKEEKIQFDLIEYLQNLIDHLTPLWRNKSIEILFKMPKKLIIHSYPSAVSQILSSLFMNAIAHGFDKKETGKINIELAVQGAYVLWVFRDDGEGMPPEVRAKIFDPFATTKRSQGRSGLGAHIMYNLITQRLGGQIKCQSEIGKGTEFVMKFPVESP